MIVSEFDPFLGPPARVAGFAKLTALDGAELLIASVRDVHNHPTERVQALTALLMHSPHLGISTASSLIADAADGVRRAAMAVVQQHQLSPEPDVVG